VLFRMKQQRFAWVSALPTAWLLICTLSAGWLKLFSDDPKVGFLSHAAKFAGAAAQGKVLAPAKSMAQMERIIFNDRVDAALCGFFMVVVLAIMVATVRTCLAALRSETPTACEVAA